MSNQYNNFNHRNYNRNHLNRNKNNHNNRNHHSKHRLRPLSKLQEGYYPLGIRVLTHDYPPNQKSWAPHASKRFYIGPALNHYQSLCQMVTIQKLNVPAPTPDELLHHSIQDFFHALIVVNHQKLPHLNLSSIQLIRHL